MASDAQALLLQVSADTSKALKSLEGLNKKLAGVATTAERSGKQAATGLERFFGKADAGKALDKVFDSTRFKVLDSGVARVGIFGSALESLGPAGLAAAAGVGALAAAFAGAREAAKFADDISDTANRLHVTTDALQEYRYAIRAAGGEEAGADQALEAFSETLGKAHEGLGKAQKGFLAIGFTKAQIDSMTDVDDALQQVADKLVGLSAADRDAAISQLGLTGLKEVLDGGAGKIANLRAEAQKLGIVMDSDLVKRGGELNDQFETVSKVIDIQLKSALVDLGPVLVKLLGLLADMARGAADIADAFRSIENKRTEHLKSLRAEFQARAESPVGLVTGAHDRKRVAEIDAELNKREVSAINDQLRAADKAPTRAIGKAGGAGGGHKSTPRDDTVQRSEQVNSAIASAERDMLQALLGLATDAETRAKLQKDILAQESAEATAHLNKQIADIQDDKGLSAAKKEELIARLQQVKADTAAAEAARATAIDREREEQLAHQALDLKQTTLDGEEAVLRLQQELSRSSTEQQTIALRLVDIAYQREKAELESLIALQKAAGADTRLAELKLKQLNEQQPGKVEQATREGSDPARQANSIISDVTTKGNLAEDTAAMYAEIERQRQANLISEQQAQQANAQVNARYLDERLANAEAFFGDLASLTSSSNKTLHAIGKAAAIAQATLQGVVAVQNALATPAPWPIPLFMAAAAGVAAAVNVAKIASMADGGRVTGPGGPRADKVPIWASNGEYMVNAKATQKYLPALEAMNNGRMPHFADGGMIGRNLGAGRISVRGREAPAAPVHFHLEGAVVTQELVDQMNAVSQTHARTAYSNARRDAAGDAAAVRYREDLNS